MDISHDARPVVGIDLHRRRTVLITVQADGAVVGKPQRILNYPARLKAAVAVAGPDPRVVGGRRPATRWRGGAHGAPAGGEDAHAVPGEERRARRA